MIIDARHRYKYVTDCNNSVMVPGTFLEFAYIPDKLHDTDLSVLIGIGGIADEPHDPRYGKFRR